MSFFGRRFFFSFNISNRLSIKFVRFYLSPILYIYSDFIIVIFLTIVKYITVFYAYTNKGKNMI